MTPVILLPGKLTTSAVGVRGDSFSTGRLYSESVARAGGVALQIPPIAQSIDAVSELVSRCDGVIIQGGGDVDPERYGEKALHEKLYGIMPEHDAMEIAIVHAAITQDKPLLAICRGMQILNVALGGTLHQDLGDVLDEGESHSDTYHPITLESDSRVAQAMGTTKPQHSHSYHHQVLSKVADSLRVVGRAPDGIIEAVEHKSARWIVGVQWHPEDDASSDTEQQKLFDSFVNAARKT